MWKVKTLSLQRCALCKIHVAESQTTRDQIMCVEGSHARDQIALWAFHTLLVEVQTNC